MSDVVDEPAIMGENALLDWVEAQALENLRFHIQTAELLTKEANSMLMIVLAGVGGVSAYTVKLVDTHAAYWLMVATVTFGICLLGLAARLIVKCMKIDVIPAPTNEPRNIYQPTYSLRVLREVELENIQVRIEDVRARNEKVADRLDRIRLYALVVPVISAVAGLMVLAALALHGGAH